MVWTLINGGVYSLLTIKLENLITSLQAVESNKLQEEITTSPLTRHFSELDDMKLLFKSDIGSDL